MLISKQHLTLKLTGCPWPKGEDGKFIAVDQQQLLHYQMVH